MNKGEILEMAERIEAGSPDMQGALLEQAWEAVAKVSASFRTFACEPCSGFGTNAGKFAAALEARAFESASIMLVPEGWVATLTVYHDGAVVTLADDRINPVRLDNVEVSAKAPALALTAAALRAIASTMEE